ncbi:hypothetical protein EPI10_006950 [Gossypium australe]|uniref:Reverse transcriptase Ty1/copia-type domain-containing protein n=1 Tax=Gossypium australe TaxID=47621 RepID=A0A5B6WU83_9ROSI|nr:hypothetical protein EPI10_006950 [Gossypium australe]
MNIKFAKCLDMNLSKHLAHGINDLIKRSRLLDLGKTMKDFRESNFILGIQILRDRKKKVIALLQVSYIDKICNTPNTCPSPKQDFRALPEHSETVTDKSYKKLFINLGYS